MRVCHKITADFDDPNLVSSAGLVPVMALAAIAFNLTRAAGTLASARHARARPATIRTQLINVPARIANRARRLHLHLPTHWPWQDAWEGLFTAAYAPPGAAAA